MNQVAVFRFFVVASLVFGILGACVDSVVPGLLPQTLDDAYEAYAAAEEPSTLFVLALGGVALVLFIGAVVGTIGLLLFKSWSRQLSLWFSVLAMACYPFLGPDVSSGWANMLTESSMMFWGAALAMAYFSEVRTRFTSDSGNDAVRPTREDARA